jgi:nucleoside-diphosphate-sugar epimerase
VLTILTQQNTHFPIMASKVILIYGATGAIGTNLIQIISKEQQDWTILAASRSGGPTSYLASLNLHNVTLVKSDIENLEDARQITQDVDMVFSCIGFPEYEIKYWAAHWPVVVENLLQVTSSTRPLIFCDNLYAYGSTTNISPTSKTVAPSPKSKPGIRAMMRETFQKRMQSDPRSLVVVGGADFFGPRLEGKSMLGELVLSAIAAKRKASAFGSATVKHDFCYAPDFSNALYVVSVNRDAAMGKFWICPHSAKNLTVAELATKAYGLVDMKDKGVTVVPAFMIAFLGLFMTFMREMKEMMPSWTNDYTVDDSAFCSTFGVQATPIEQALRETLDYLKSAGN